jgi:hypothetical protein
MRPVTQTALTAVKAASIQPMTWPPAAHTGSERSTKPPAHRSRKVATTRRAG